MSTSGSKPHSASDNVVWEDGHISREEREQRYSQKGGVFWFTGLSGAGKSTVARALEHSLFIAGRQVVHLDGDNVRHGLCGDLGFTAEDRGENIRRIAHAARLFLDAGFIVLASFISPSRDARLRACEIIGQVDFFEVYVNASVEACEARDVKGLYARARRGEIQNFTGISAPYEAPLNPTLELRTDTQSKEESVEQVSSWMRGHGFLPGDIWP